MSTVELCEACAALAVNSDDSMHEPGDVARVEASLESLGWIVTTDTGEAGVFRCYGCDEDHYGRSVVVEFDSR